MDQVYVWRERLLPYCVEIQGLPSNTITQGLKEYFKSASEFEILQEESCWKVLVLFPQRQDADDLVAIGKLEIVLDDEDPESCTLDIYGCREACDIPLTWEKYSTEETIGTNHSTEQTDVRPTFPGRPTTDCQQWRAPSHSTNRMQYSSEKRTRPPPAYQGDPRNQFQPYHGRSDSFPVQANMPGGQWQPYGLPGSNVGPHGPPYHIPSGWSQYPLGPGPPIFGGPGPAIPFGPGQAVPLGPDSPFRTPYQMPPGYPPHTGQGPMVASASPGYQEPLQQYAQQQLLTDHSSSTQKTDSGNIKTKTVGREHVNDEVDVYANTIIVSKLPEQLRERDLKKFFESKKKSSGGPVEKVDINHENQTATVTFKEKEVVSRVLARRPILFKNAILEIEEFRVESESDDQSSEEESTDSDVEIQIDLGTIEVSGMSLGTSEDTVMFYFENKRKSGGGNIKTFEFDADNGKANITFEDTSVVDGIIRRKHALNGKTLEVKRFVPPPPVQVCEDKVLLRDVNPDTSKDALENFLELKASALPKSLIFGEVEGTVLVTFGKRIDFDTFQDGCQKRKLEGSYLKPERVPITNCVYVGGLNPITSNDALEMFFENTKRSGGGAIQKIEMSNDDHSCLIFFEDFTVVDTVCDSRQLVLDKSTLSVHPHYECLGETRDAKMPAFKAPMSVVIQDTDKIKMYAFLYQHGRRDVDQTLEAKHAQIDWPKHIDEVKFSVSSTLTATTKNVRKLAKTWNDDVLHAMSEIEESLKMKTIKILKEIWDDDFKSKIPAVASSDSLLHIVYDDQSCEVTLIGFKKDVDQKVRLIEESKLKAENDLERKKKRIKEEMNIEIPKLVLLCDLDTLSTIRRNMPDLVITADRDRGKLLFEGQITGIRTAQVQIYEIISRISSSKIENHFSNEALLFLQQKAVHDYLRSKMKEAGIRCSWDAILRDCSVIVYSLTQPDIVKAADLIKAKVVEKSHQIDRLSVSLLTTDPWNKMCNEFKKKFPETVHIAADTTKRRVQILALTEHCGKILESIDDFLAKNTIVEESMKLPLGILKHLDQFQKADLTSIEKRSTHGTLKIKISNEEMIICGSRDDLSHAKPLVTALVSNVKSKHFPLDKPGIQEILQSESGKLSRRDIEKRRTCIIEVSTNGIEDSTRSSHPGLIFASHPQPIATGTTKEGISIKTLQGDITQLKADVIVNAANSSMDHAGGLAKTIVTKGGQRIQDACTDYIKQKGHLHDGDIYCSQPGNLKCKMIAHANSPNWQGGKQREDEYLDSIVWKSIEECDRSKYASIAIPALGTGIFQYPADKATHVIMKTILEFLNENPQTTVREIYLCDTDTTAITCFTEELKRQLGEASVVNHQKPVQDQWKRMVQKDNSKRGALNIQIVKGQIATAMTDIIVNTTSQDLVLTNGAVSSSILKEAGQSIQDECRAGYPDGVRPGNVATTTGGQLGCKFIFHGALQGYKTKGAFQSFQDFVKRCLTMADDEMMTSISFPSLGTGNLGFPHDIVAAEMFKIVNEFNPTTLKEVHFVIYEKDSKSLQVFQNEETKWSSAGNQLEEPTASNSDNKSRQKRTFQNTGTLERINKSAQSPRTPESTPGAEATFGQVTVTIRMGEITEAACEAIICSTDRHFNITEGQLERAIRQKTGGNLDKEIEKLKKQLTRNGHALMSVENMKSDFILFVNAHGDFEKSLRHAMTKADDKGITSVAVPLISTGARTSTAEAFSLTISKVIAGISFRKVERIDVVLTQHADLADVTSGVKNYIDSNSPGMIEYLKGKIGYGLPDMSFRYKPEEQPTMSSITLVIYGKVERSLDAAYRDVELFCANEMVEKTIDDPIIKEFTDQQISKFDEFKESLGVKVTLEKRLHRLRISGLPRSVQNATYEINHMIKTMQLDKENEKITAKCVEWSVIEVDTTDTKRIPYPEKINHTIEKDYQKQLQTTQFFADSNCYEIDFTTMEEYPVNDQTDRAKVLRKDKLQVQQVSGLELPTTWSPMTEQEPITVEPVLATDAAYTEVSKDFEATLGQSNSTIVKIERIQNKTLYQQYVTKKAEVDRSCSIQSERMLWHGTADGAVDSINLYGFNRSFCGKNATVHGDGVYFACTSNYSARKTYSPADQAGQKRMYRCRVLTGDFTQGQQGMRVPPAKQGHILYDSVVDDTTNPNMFIIFNDTQAYPEYLITFTV